jgi:uracil-DNA glycosylase
MTDNYGVFPFGQPNTVRPMRMPAAGESQVTVVGVYPSALHVRWEAPSYLAAPDRRGAVASLAVDVEPEVFWTGDDVVDRVAFWQRVSGFRAGDAPGTHGRAVPGMNGPSGRTVESRYLTPLNATAAETAFTDVCPVFFVKDGTAKRPGQGRVIAREYNAVAADMGVIPSSLPRRPSPRDLVRLAVDKFSQRLVADLEQADAPIVVSLGEEALQTLCRVPQLAAVPPAQSLTELYGDRYGAEGELRVNGRAVRWLPLVHPGLLKGDPPSADDPVDPNARTVQGFNVSHARWERDVPARR